MANEMRPGKLSIVCGDERQTDTCPAFLDQRSIFHRRHAEDSLRSVALIKNLWLFSCPRSISGRLRSRASERLKGRNTCVKWLTSRVAFFERCLGGAGREELLEKSWRRWLGAPRVCELDGEAVLVELRRVHCHQTGEALARSIDDVQITVRTVIPAEANVGAGALIICGVHLQ